jgi:hypothetical protein
LAGQPTAPKKIASCRPILSFQSRHHPPVLLVIVARGEIEMILPQFKAELLGRGLEDAHALRHHLLADAVARDDGDAIDAIGGLFLSGRRVHWRIHGFFLPAPPAIRAAAAALSRCSEDRSFDAENTCPRHPEVRAARRASKDAPPRPSPFEARRYGEVPGVVLRGSLRSHLRMTPGLEPRLRLRVTD